MRYRYLIIASLVAVAALAGCRQASPDSNTSKQEMVDGTTFNTEPLDLAADKHTTRMHFGKLHSSFRFSAEVPRGWDVEYVADLQSLNIYNPSNAADNVRDKSQIFIRQFTANDFLTLSTVDIINRSEDEVNGHPAVRYEIVKKPSVPDFAGQPTWRNSKHSLIDIRYSSSRPSVFYVIAYTPELADEQFESFIESIQFDNDRSSFVSPLSDGDERVTLKPFGLYVTPQDSPVDQERFIGYHTGADFEVLPEELSEPVLVRAICGGTLRLKDWRSGYGGVVVQNCLLDDEPVTVVYGHLDIASVDRLLNYYYVPGEVIGELGDDESTQTDGERKHLHLSIHTGSGLDIRGYVPTEAQLAAWIDPMTIFSFDN